MMRRTISLVVLSAFAVAVCSCGDSGKLSREEQLPGVNPELPKIDGSDLVAHYDLKKEPHRWEGKRITVLANPAAGETHNGKNYITVTAVIAGLRQPEMIVQLSNTTGFAKEFPLRGVLVEGVMKGTIKIAKTDWTAPWDNLEPDRHRLTGHAILIDDAKIVEILR